ncbi:DUF2568 domain-containing protein [Goekera deserti]|uniref:DUF2568 domain-containing protein n=1 Tax=Goekera deserti TaxID=2497753 RepID=UPI00192E8A67|nr:DUF2568 domain-containing protein [Goekera deserti]
MRVLLAAGLPLAAAVLWGLFAAPRAARASAGARAVVQVLVFGGAALALGALSGTASGVLFAVLAAGDVALAAVLPAASGGPAADR